MKINLIMIGKTNAEYINSGILEYTKRLQKFAKLELIIIPDIKNAKSLSQEEVKKEEAKLILSKLKDSKIILLDNNGKEFTSIGFSDVITKFQNDSEKSISFVIGGAYGFDESIYSRSDMKISLSRMTFSHQIVRLIFLEQLYRAFTIINNHPYHNE